MTRARSMVLVSSAVLVLVLSADGAIAETGPVDLEALRRNGENWETVAQDLDPTRGFARLHREIWYMHFLHWRPLQPDGGTLDTKVVRSLMSSFWGPSMPFDFTGNEGTLEVGGHPAVFVEGTLNRGQIKTRFVVWDCPESGRRLIADENINQRVKTPQRFLDVQRQITMSTSCHGQHAEQATSSWNDLGIAMSVPDFLRTSVFGYTTWYPDGVSRERGSLWTLPTDSQELIEVRWYEDDRPLSRELLEEVMEELGATPDSSLDRDTIEVTGSDLADQMMLASGSFDVVSTFGEVTERNPFVFRAWLWRDEGLVKVLVVSMLCQGEIWGMENDLTPTAEVIDRFISDSVWPATASFRN